MFRTLAFLFGLAFIIAGVLGFFPSFAPNGDLLHCFRVNPMHNIVHLITGIIALSVCFQSSHASKLFFQIFGSIYVLVGIIGFFYIDENIFGLIANNMADVWLHLFIGAISLFIGFGIKEKTAV
jgi:hypothetical protein